MALKIIQEGRKFLSFPDMKVGCFYRRIDSPSNTEHVYFCGFEGSGSSKRLQNLVTGNKVMSSGSFIEVDVVMTLSDKVG